MTKLTDQAKTILPEVLARHSAFGADVIERVYSIYKSWDSVIAILDFCQMSGMTTPFQAGAALKRGKKIKIYDMVESDLKIYIGGEEVPRWISPDGNHVFFKYPGMENKMQENKPVTGIKWSLLLAIVAWINFFVLAWLMIFGAVDAGVIQKVALILFFLTAFVSSTTINPKKPNKTAEVKPGKDTK